MSGLVTDADLERSRRDPAFKQKLLTESFQRLLVRLEQLDAPVDSDSNEAQQMREGVELAVKLANILHKKDGDGGGSTPQAA